MEVNTSISPSLDMQRKSRLLSELGILGGCLVHGMRTLPHRGQETLMKSVTSSFQALL